VRDVDRQPCDARDGEDGDDLSALQELEAP
jgi:hypothetical protein